VQKVRDSLEPEDWCGDEKMIDVLDRVLAQKPCCSNMAAGTSRLSDPNANCPLLATPPAAPVPLTDEQVDAATKAWFENDIVAGRYPFRKRMRAAFAAAHRITEKGSAT
jgi:hypothetical protein